MDSKPFHVSVNIHTSLCSVVTPAQALVWGEELGSQEALSHRAHRHAHPGTGWDTYPVTYTLTALRLIDDNVGRHIAWLWYLDFSLWG